MQLDVVSLTKELVAIESETHHSNRAVSDRIQATMDEIGFTVERIAFDDNGVEKVSLVGKLGEGEGGLGLFGHSDVVPGGVGWEPYRPEVGDGRLYGRGSCDMKGALATMLVAASRTPVTALRHPLFVVVTSDEEAGHLGAINVVANSEILNQGWPAWSIVGEPTELTPVYAHKGGSRVTVTARGVAAHASTDLGVSANFLIAPFLAEMAELASLFKRDERFMNYEFDPPTNGFNMTVDDDGCKLNVTAAKTVCTLGLRTMPNANNDEAISMIFDRARSHDLDVESWSFPPFYVSPQTEIVEAACKVTGAKRAFAVPYGTEAVWYQQHSETIVLGPGDIAQAHTVGEWVEIEQLHSAVDIYQQMIKARCA